MALTNCPDCNNPMSTAAQACPRCGAPNPLANTTITTQRTDKHLKKHIVIGSLILALGVLWVLNAAKYPPSIGPEPIHHNQMIGVAIAIVGVVHIISTKVRIWWHHD